MRARLPRFFDNGDGCAVGAEFDPNYHQAVTYDVSPDHREGEVIEELQRGYKLGERLLRPAMVKVAKAS